METTSCYFNRVLYAIGEMREEMIKSPMGQTPEKICNSVTWMPYFKGCIGAIDGTHVIARVPRSQDAAYRGRKHYTNQNVLSVVDFNMMFTYVLAGWEGSAHDATIFADSMSRPDGINIPDGKFYLGDAGYGRLPRILPPFRSTRYHLNKFTGRNRPQNAKELFNLRHSSLRVTVERAFAALKNRLKILDQKPLHTFPTTGKASACMLHTPQLDLGETVNSFEVSIDEAVYSAKFIERKHWLITGDRDGYIHVYDYDTMEAVKNFEAHENHVMSLAVSPTYPFVLSASDDPLIKLWGWNKDWKCMRTFEGHYNTVTKVVFDPKNDISFASASLDRRVKIWNIFTGECNTFDEQPDGQLSLQYFENKQLRYVRKFLIVISSDGVAKVWHPETRSCVDTLQGHTDRLNALCWLPEDQVLVTGSLDGTLQIWKPTNSTHRLENTTGLNLGAVNALGYIPESRRVVVGCEQGIAVVEID